MKLVTSVESEGQIKLDLKDKKILTILSKDVRTPISKIAKDAGLSRDAVNYRIRLYEKLGLVQGYRTIINIARFGFENYHIFILLNKPSKEDENRIIDELVSLSFIRAILKFSGKYDLELAIIARSIKEFESYLDLICSICSKYLSNYEIIIITKYYHTSTFPKNFLNTKEKVQNKRKTDKKYKIDTKDFTILKIIANDARIPVYEISRKMNLSPDAVSYRLRKMLDAGYISNFVPAVNYSMIGYNVYAILMNIRYYNEKQEAGLQTFFKTDNNILWAVKTIGKYNLLFYVSAQNPTAVYETISNLRNLFPDGIRDYEVLIAYEEVKYSYLPEIIFNK